LIIPDLYRGKVATDREEAGHLMHGLDWVGAVQDISGAAKYLKANGVDGKIGVVGFCMGGALTLASSVHVKEVSAGVVFYGIPSDQLADVTKAATPLQLHFGDKDAIEGFSSPKEQDKLEEKLKKANIPHEFYRYKDAAHAFSNDAHPEVYNASAATESRDRTLAFFKKHLA